MALLHADRKMVEDMMPAQYEAALLCLRSYQAAKSDNTDELLCIACVFRNRVQRFGKTYTQILEESELNRGWPDVRNPVLIDPQTGLLSQVEAIYRNELPDYTANHLHKNGAMWFGRVMDHQGRGDWFEETILKNPTDHPLIGAFGVQNFYE